PATSTLFPYTTLFRSPCTLEAVHLFKEAGILYAPGKAANAGGVAVSGLEISQNATRRPWTPQQVEDELVKIMARIHDQCAEHGEDRKSTRLNSSHVKI